PSPTYTATPSPKPTRPPDPLHRPQSTTRTNSASRSQTKDQDASNGSAPNNAKPKQPKASSPWAPASTYRRLDGSYRSTRYQAATPTPTTTPTKTRSTSSTWTGGSEYRSSSRRSERRLAKLDQQLESWRGSTRWISP